MNGQNAILCGKLPVFEVFYIQLVFISIISREENSEKLRGPCLEKIKIEPLQCCLRSSTLRHAQNLFNLISILSNKVSVELIEVLS